MKKKSAYARAGVDIERADDLVRAIGPLAAMTRKGHPRLGGVGGYASLYPIGGGRFIAATTDGVGTKLKLAFETGVHGSVGIDLVAMSVNDLICVGAKPLFFLDYFATGKLKLGVAKSVIAGVARGCIQAGCALVGGETAEMPSMYQAGEYDLAGFAVGTVSQREILGGRRVRPGDVLLGIPSSGPHSNGFSLIRKLIPRSRAKTRLLRECFKPTRIYVDEFNLLKRTCGNGLHGMAHITGSGWLNVPRLNEDCDYVFDLDKAGYKMPWVFEELARVGKLSLHELFTTFNMGVGLVIAVDPDVEKRALSVLRKSGVRVLEVGRVLGPRKKKSATVAIRMGKQTIELQY